MRFHHVQKKQLPRYAIFAAVVLFVPTIEGYLR